LVVAASTNANGAPAHYAAFRYELVITGLPVDEPNSTPTAPTSQSSEASDRRSHGGLQGAEGGPDLRRRDGQDLMEELTRPGASRREHRGARKARI